jgi:Zn-dependent protease/CBS domain-containing protein
MTRNMIPLGRIVGIPVGLDLSWFLIFVLLTWSLATSYFPSEFAGWPTSEYWIVGAVTSVLLFASVLLHEVGHSVVALRYKVPVRRITLMIFGGVAELGSEPPSATSEFWIAIAGPVVSFGLAVVFSLLRPLVAGVAPILALAEYLAFINGTLALFNLVPGFPLDGGRVFRAMVWGVTGNLRRATLIAANVGRLFAFGFILVGVYMTLTGNVGNGLWIAFIGWFLESAASAQLSQQRIQDLLAGHRVQDVMSPGCPQVEAATPVQELVDRHILGGARRCLVVTEGDQPAGLLTVHNLSSIPKSNWGRTTAADVMTTMADLRTATPGEDLWPALADMDRQGVNQLPVVDQGRVVGMLTREDVLSYLQTLQAIGP